MAYDCNEKQDRQSIRLRKYDYCSHGAYFVTICAHNRFNDFGKLSDDEMRLNFIGKTVAKCWGEIPTHFKFVKIGLSVIMPNHFHGILFISDQGTACRAPTVERFGKPTAGSLSTMIRSFKSAVTKQVNQRRKTPGAPVWQRNYYEHVIRDEEELNRVRQYILDNPASWDIDQNNPDFIQSKPKNL